MTHNLKSHLATPLLVLMVSALAACGASPARQTEPVVTIDQGVLEGAEVDGVLHPAAPGALAYYDYRLADSLTLVLPERELWVYKVEIRPRDLSGPGVVGAMYLERVHADIVRMEFTFTAASYLDPELDYLNVRLENVLWAGRFWLPFRQGLELRREFLLEQL